MEDLLAGAVFALFLAAQLLAVIVLSRESAAERAREAAAERGRRPAWPGWQRPKSTHKQIGRPV